jgi:uncharacterized repeat protein (TIGR03803 family)
VGGTLYGTTASGGAHSCSSSSFQGCGTVFSVTLGGTEKVLYSFSKSPDGNAPEAGLIDVGGTLYGTTTFGGTVDTCGYSTDSGSCGTVFSITPRGGEKVLFSFRGHDGTYPLASLIELRGRLFGTTFYGGSYTTCGYDELECGTVFSITTGGTEKVLYSFGKVTDGADPAASLIKVKGTLYGTTENGGTQDEGTVFSVTPSGKEKVLHSFGNGTDGKGPAAALIDVKGTLYGTTAGGGTNGNGAVFALAP